MPRSTRNVLTIAAKVAPKVEIGLGTLAGLVAAGGQYAGALAEALAAGETSSTTVALITTATVTLITTIGGRMAQAFAAIRALNLNAPTPLEPIAGELDAGVMAEAVDVQARDTALGLTRRVRELERRAGIIGRGTAADSDDDQAEDRGDEYSDARTFEAADDEGRGRIEPGPAEAAGDDALEPAYEGRAPAGSSHDDQVKARLKLEQRGDACAAVEGGHR